MSLNPIRPWRNIERRKSRQIMVGNVPVGGDALDSSVSPLGFRMLSKVPRLPGAIVDRLVEHFGSLQRLLAAGIDDLMAVDGVGVDPELAGAHQGLARQLQQDSVEARAVHAVSGE